MPEKYNDDIASQHRLWTTQADEVAEIRIVHEGHPDAHKLLVTKGGIIDKKLVVRLGLTPERIEKAERYEPKAPVNRAIETAPTKRA